MASSSNHSQNGILKFIVYLRTITNFFVFTEANFCLQPLTNHHTGNVSLSPSMASSSNHSQNGIL
jgi:hypothetical protein